MPSVFVTIPKTEYDERSSFNATSYYRSGDAALASTTAEYRIDCLTTGTLIQDWTTLTPATSISIPVTSENNRIVDSNNKRERRQMTVSSDRGTSTETRDVVLWKINNIRGYDG